MIEFKNVTKTYLMGKTKFEALRGLDFKIETGELVAIVGPSGSGKSTTMQILGLLDKPTTGVYLLDGEDTSHLTRNEQAYLRNRMIGFIFQSFFLLPKLTAIQNVGLPLFYAGVNSREIKQRAQAILDRVEMLPFADHKPNELSGGQKQRVAIARALIGTPKILLADEPTGALDTATSEVVLDLMIHQAKGTTVVIITHDKDVAAQCPRIIEIRDGLIQEK